MGCINVKRSRASFLPLDSLFSNALSSRLVNHEAISDEKGKIKFVEKSPVAFSIASDFSVLSNVLLGRSSSYQYRLNCDIVDLPKTLNSLTD